MSLWPLGLRDSQVKFNLTKYKQMNLAWTQTIFEIGSLQGV